MRVVEGGGNAADSGPSAEAVAAPGASAGASDVLGDGARPTDFVLATQLSQLFDAVLPNQVLVCHPSLPRPVTDKICSILFGTRALA